MRQLDWERETPKMMAARKNGNHVIDYRTPLFSIRAVRSAIISDGATYSKYNPLTPDQKDKTPFGVITTIKSVSKSAVERNRVRTRFKEAVRLAISRTPTEGGLAGSNSRDGFSAAQVDLPAGKCARKRLARDAYSRCPPSTGYHHLATLSPGIYAESMTSLVHQTRSAMIALSNQAHITASTSSAIKPHQEVRSRGHSLAPRDPFSSLYRSVSN